MILLALKWEAQHVDEVVFRERVFSALEERLAQGAGCISSAELASFDVAGEPRRVIANPRGIWNPRDMEATLSVVSSADGPYADEEISPGAWRYDYEAGSIHGSNT